MYESSIFLGIGLLTLYIILINKNYNNEIRILRKQLNKTLDLTKKLALETNKIKKHLNGSKNDN